MEDHERKSAVTNEWQRGAHGTAWCREDSCLPEHPHLTPCPEQCLFSRVTSFATKIKPTSLARQVVELVKASLLEAINT